MNKNKLQKVQALFKRGSTCNHLGSTAFVTDANATVTQGFLYAPFGEITTEYNAGFANGIIPKYSFNAKELDEETGMYYYEARYMAPPTFISRDPHFERYFWTSPYGYCSNNPLNRVDPTGMDEWEIDGSGNVVNHTKTTEHDAFYMVDKDGKRIEGKSIEFEYGSIKQEKSKYNNVKTAFKIAGDGIGRRAFEFLAENTDIEWGLLQTGNDSKSANFIFTSCLKYEVSDVPDLIIGCYIRAYIHSHPEDPSPSFADIKNMENYQKYNIDIRWNNSAPYAPMRNYGIDEYPYCAIYCKGKYYPFSPQQNLF